MFQFELPVGVSTVGFADDLEVLATAPTSGNVEVLMSTALGRIKKWMAANGLDLSSIKTKAEMLSQWRNQNNPVVTLEGYPVSLRTSVEYLGVTLDSTSSFRRYISEASHRSAKAAVAVSRLMPNVGGPSGAKREILMAVAMSRNFGAKENKSLPNGVRGGGVFSGRIYSR